MITVFNRKEIYVGEMKGYGRVCDALESAGIKYYLKTNSMYGGTIKFGIDSTCIYYVYVNKKDYDEACHVTGRENIR